MTRILCVTANYPPHHLGGYETSCYDVMVRLVERGHEVTVLTSDEYLPGVATPPGERSAAPAVLRDLRRYFRDHDLWAPTPWVRWKMERDNQRATAAAIAVARPDVIAVWHVAAFSLGVVTALHETGVPIVYAVSDDWLSYCTVLDQWIKLLERTGPLARWLQPLLRVPTTAPDLGRTGWFCFISECTRERSNHYARWQFPNSSIIYSGFDASLFTPRKSAPPWRWRLLYVGRFDPRKGIETLIRAMPLLPPEATLEVQGTGDDVERARLQQLATSLGVGSQVRFERVPRDEVPERYRAADVCVFPSEWEEPFGLVPLEAMSCGVPVVATAVGGSGEFLFDGRNCLRFTAGDPEDAARAICRLAEDPQLRSDLVEAGFATAAYFDADHLADAFEEWYVAAASGYPDGPPASRAFELGVAGAEA